MHAARGIEEVRAGIALEHREALADLDDPEAHRLRDRRLRHRAVDDGLEALAAAQARVVSGRCHAVAHGFGHGAFHVDAIIVYTSNEGAKPPPREDPDR